MPRLRFEGLVERAFDLDNLSIVDGFATGGAGGGGAGAGVSPPPKHMMVYPSFKSDDKILSVCACRTSFNSLTTET